MACVARTFPVVALVWALALPLAASVPAGSRRSSGVARVVHGAVYAAGAVVCHQRPERSFSWGAESWPVCARCTGLYGGAALAALVIVGGERRSRRSSARVPMAAQQAVRESAADRWRTRVVIAAALVPTMITVGQEWTTGDVPSNLVRAIAGLPIGLAVSWLVLRDRTPQRAVGVN
jgi:hypothetical protein